MRSNNSKRDTVTSVTMSRPVTRHTILSASAAIGAAKRDKRDKCLGVTVTRHAFGQATLSGVGRAGAQSPTIRVPQKFQLWAGVVR